VSDDAPQSYSEKRRARRLTKRFILRVAAFGDKPLRWSYVTIHNLSATGAMFTYDQQAYEGMLLHLRIDFPDRVIECLGRVVRMAGVREGQFHDVAVQIEGMTSGDRDYVEDFVHKNLP
jgi:hypothetical protein